ncbi:MAG: ceramidase domain-containing protein [Anaerolineae bacterium]
MRFRLIIPVVIIGLGAVVASASLPIDWSTWRPATCWPDACFCEAISAGSIRQPINTWSNLAFVIVGVIVAADRVLRRSDRLIFAWACVAIGLGSMFYHASLSFVGQWFDVMSMYLLGTFMVLYAARRLKSTRNWNFAAYYAVINVALGVLLIVWPDARRYLFGVLISVALVLETILQRRHQTTAKPPWLIAALTAYVIAQVIWTLDLNHIVCDPNSFIQGHAVWHVLTAISAGLVYGYYRSEEQSKQPPVIQFV